MGLPKFAEVKTLVRVPSCAPGLPPASSPGQHPATAPVLSSQPPTLTWKPPSVQSPFAQPRCYLDWGDVFHLLRERYPTVIAPTGSCVHPLASPALRLLASFQESVQVATQPLLPMGCSRCYLRRSFPRCLAHNPHGPIEGNYLFLPRCHRPSLDPS